MFVRTLADVAALCRTLSLVNGTTHAARFLVAADGVGFSYSDARCDAGSTATIWYKNHWEANYIVEGKAELTELSGGRSWTLAPGSLYVVGPNDHHVLHTPGAEHHVSVFHPALRGDERHDADGAFEPSGPIARTDGRMFVKTIDELRAAGYEKTSVTGNSKVIRMLTQDDGVGFTLSDVRVKAGAESVLWYKHHWEANHVLSGTLEVEDLATGKIWTLEPDMIYCVGPKDRHKIRARSAVHLLSIFCPPLRGDERHDADGSLPPSGPVPPGPA
ncbi:MAG: ectoine synthase [Alphaproteobacteria bacterium]